MNSDASLAIILAAAPQMTSNGKHHEDTGVTWEWPGPDGLVLSQREGSMSANNGNASQPSTPEVSTAESALRNAADKMIADVMAVEIDPRRLICQALGRNATRPYPNDRRYAQALLMLQTFEPDARALMGDLTALRRRIWELDSACLVLVAAPPEPIPTWDEHVQRWIGNGWTASDLSLDRLWCHLDGARETKERIISQSEIAITLTSGKILTREQLGLPPIRKPVRRVESGPTYMIGQVIPE